MPRLPQNPLRSVLAAVLTSVSLFAVPASAAGSGPPPEADSDASTHAPAGADSAPIPGYFADGGAARGIAVAEERGIDLDPDDVREAQDSAIARQAHDAGEAWIGISSNAFWRGLDRFHDGTFRLLDNLVRTLDLSWTVPGENYDVRLSSFALEPMARGGGRGNAGDYDAKVKVRVDTALPGLERRFHLVFDNAGRNHLPGSDPMTQESDWRLGIKSGWSGRRGAKFDLGGGVRLRAGRIVGYGDASVKWEYPFAGGRWRFSPGVFYYTDRAWGQDAHLSWIRWFGHAERWGVGLFVSEENTDHDDTFDFENTFKLARVQGTHKNRGWVFQASLFPRIREGSGNFYLDDALLAFSWKSSVYRRWLYATVTPQVDFAKEDSREPECSIRVGFEVLFGGEARQLL